MSIPKEHDYIGLSETSPMENNSENLSSSSSSSSSSYSSSTEEGKKSTCLNLKATELRLGLPGSESPRRKPGMSVTGVSLFGKEIDTKDSNVYSLGSSKNCVSGAKRVFSDAINESSDKWVFSGNNGSDVELSKGAVLFSPRGENGNIQKPKGAGVINPSLKPDQEKINQVSVSNENTSAPAAKAQVVGWPPIRSFRKKNMALNLVKSNEEAEGKSGIGYLYVKVSMDGAPYLRKVDLKTYTNYVELSSALEKMFSCFTIGQCGRDGLSEARLKDILQGCEYVLTYEDKDSDWMLVGDVPWEMFTDTCRRLRIMKGSEAIGLGMSLCLLPRLSVSSAPI